MPKKLTPCPKCGKISRKVWCKKCKIQKRPYMKQKGDKPPKKWKPLR